MTIRFQRGSWTAVQPPWNVTLHIATDPEVQEANAALLAHEHAIPDGAHIEGAIDHVSGTLPQLEVTFADPNRPKVVVARAPKPVLGSRRLGKMMGSDPEPIESLVTRTLQFLRQNGS